MKRCPICGEARRLGPDGLCAWRAGCEHRAMILEAREADLERELQHILAPSTPLELGIIRRPAEGCNDFDTFREEWIRQVHWLADNHEQGWLEPGEPPDDWPLG